MSSPMTLTLREFHRFTASGTDFVYLVPSAAIFQLDPAASAIIARLGQGDAPASDLVRELSARFPLPNCKRPSGNWYASAPSE